MTARSITEPRARFYGVRTEHDRNEGRSRDYLTVWSGPFSSVWEADGVSLPKGDGYMLTTYNGDKVRVTCPTPRNEDNYREVDDAIVAALRAHYGEPDPACPDHGRGIHAGTCSGNVGRATE